LGLGQHGFARSEIWTYHGKVLDNEAGVSVKFTLDTPKKYEEEYPTSLEYIVTLSVHELTNHLVVHNKSSTKTVSHQALLHTYFACDSSTAVATPFKGLTFVDKANNFVESVSEEDEVTFKVYTDRFYKNAGGNYTLKYSGGGVHIRTTGFKDVVTWNPQAEAGRGIPDMEEGGWDKYVCVEPGMASYYNEIPPGGKWSGQQVLSTL